MEIQQPTVHGGAIRSRSVSILRLAVVIYLPWLVCAAAFATGLEWVRGIMFSVHGGIGLLLLWFSAPWALLITTALAVQAKRAGGTARARDVVFVGLVYPAAAWPFSSFLRWAFSPPFTDSTLDYYRVVMFPFSQILSR